MRFILKEDSAQKMAVKSEMSLSADFIGIFMQDKSELPLIRIFNV